MCNFVVKTNINHIYRIMQMEKNEIFDNIMARTSVRSYTSQPIEEGKLLLPSWFVATWARRWKARSKSFGFKIALPPLRTFSWWHKACNLEPYGQPSILSKTATKGCSNCWIFLLISSLSIPSSSDTRRKWERQRISGRKRTWCLSNNTHHILIYNHTVLFF